MAFCEKCHNIFNVSDRIYVQHKGGINYSKLVEAILDEEIDAQQLKQINLDSLFSSKDFNDLDEDEQAHIEEQIDKILETSTKLKGSASMNRNAYYVCNVCGFNKPIEPNTTVYTKIIIDKNELIDMKTIKMLIHDPILPRTRAYDCINKKCLSHTSKSDEKEVTIYKDKISRVVYICNICQTSWFAH